MAQEGAALYDADDSRRRPLRVIALGGAMEFGIEPVGAPFPSVTGYRIEAEAVRRKGIHGTGARVTVLGGIEPWELSLPDVASVFASGPQTPINATQNRFSNRFRPGKIENRPERRRNQTNFNKFL